MLVHRRTPASHKPMINPYPSTYRMMTNYKHLPLSIDPIRRPFEFNLLPQCMMDIDAPVHTACSRKGVEVRGLSEFHPKQVK
eukprot:jgi/Botrbrau1/23087/Bobra.0243s0026.1